MELIAAGPQIPSVRPKFQPASAPGQIIPRLDANDTSSNALTHAYVYTARGSGADTAHVRWGGGGRGTGAPAAARRIRGGGGIRISHEYTELSTDNRIASPLHPIFTDVVGQVPADGRRRCVGGGARRGGAALRRAVLKGDQVAPRRGRGLTTNPTTRRTAGDQRKWEVAVRERKRQRVREPGNEEGDACGAGFLARQLVESNDAVISALQPWPALVLAPNMFEYSPPPNPVTWEHWGAGNSISKGNTFMPQPSWTELVIFAKNVFEWKAHVLYYKVHYKADTVIDTKIFRDFSLVGLSQTPSLRALGGKGAHGNHVAGVGEDETSFGANPHRGHGADRCRPTNPENDDDNDDDDDDDDGDDVDVVDDDDEDEAG
eukprot:gene22200-biopygen13263